MYVLVKNGRLVYPYSVPNLLSENPQVSFPSNPTENLLAEYGVFPVKAVDRPQHDFMSETVVEGLPSFDEETQRWVQTWQVRDKTQEELQAERAGRSDEIRNERNRLLSASDWTQVADSPVNKSAWAAYRQALRDIPSQQGFPWQVTWPAKPE